MIGRIGQGLRALTGFARPVQRDAAEELLTPALMVLFGRMRRSEQLHSLRVMQTLRQRGHADPDLLVAALLHDCGKSRYRFTLPERTLSVLVKKLSPELFEEWASGEARGWRRMFVIAARHPVWSADDMAAAGASARAVSLARRHQNPPIVETHEEEDRLLALLQAADNDN